MTCNFEDYRYKDFKYPHRGYTEKDRLGLAVYECCKTHGLNEGPFTQDKTFNLTVWPQISLSSLAVVFSMVLIAGISMALWKQFRQRSGRSQQGQYNVYNIYLVLLGIPDLILNVFVIGLYGSYVNQIYVDKFTGHIVHGAWRAGDTIPLDTAIIQACSVANIYLNVVVSYEVFILLKNSHQRKRHTPPSLRRAQIQAAVVFGMAMIVFIFHYFLVGHNQVNMKVMFPISLLFSYVIPAMYLGYICIVIWRRKFLLSLEGKARDLALYFGRIILVFVVVWLPAMILLNISFASWKRTRVVSEWEKYHRVEIHASVYTIGLLLCALQPILSTCMALTKTDVRKAVFDLITLSDCRSSSRQAAIITINREVGNEEEKIEEGVPPEIFHSQQSD